jgi:hypothetical protein
LAESDFSLDVFLLGGSNCGGRSENVVLSPKAEILLKTRHECARNFLGSPFQSSNFFTNTDYADDTDTRRLGAIEQNTL